MNCTCGVEIAAQSAIGGRCARCAAKTPAAVEYGGGTLTPLDLSPVPVEPGRITHFTNETDTTLAGPVPDGVITYDDVKKEYEIQLGPVPAVRKKGK